MQLTHEVETHEVELVGGPYDGRRCVIPMLTPEIKAPAPSAGLDDVTYWRPALTDLEIDRIDAGDGLVLRYFHTACYRMPQHGDSAL